MTKTRKNYWTSELARKTVFAVCETEESAQSIGEFGFGFQISLNSRYCLHAEAWQQGVNSFH
jgi:hypothetical protein